MLYSPNFATAIGPILGGVLVQAPGWRWIFWVPAIASEICLSSIDLFLPETSRFIAGKVSRKTSTYHHPLIDYYQLRKVNAVVGSNEAEVARRAFRIRNPLATLRILAARDSLLITAIYGIYNMTFSCFQGSLSNLFIEIYGLSELKARLVYLPFGVGSCVGAYCSGTIICPPRVKHIFGMSLED
jgi:MFS family permease